MFKPLRLIIVAILFIFNIHLSAQTVDSTAVASIDSLFKVAGTYVENQEFQKALEANIAAKEIALEKLGWESEKCAMACFNQGRILIYLGKFTDAESSLLEAKSIREKVWGKNHMLYSTVLNNLGNLYIETEQYERALTPISDAILIQANIKGKDTKRYASLNSNLGALYLEMGQLEKAESHFLETKKTLERLQDTQSNEYTMCLNNFGVLYNKIGQYEKSKNSFYDSSELKKIIFGENNIEYAKALGNLAASCALLEESIQAEEFFLKSLSIYENVLGKEHYEYVIGSGNLANLYTRQKMFEKAEKILLECLSLYNIHGQEKNTLNADLNNVLATIYEAKGEFSQAEALYLESMEILENRLGNKHPDYAKSLFRLAKLYNNMAQFEKVTFFTNASSEINRKLVAKALHHLSEIEMNQYLTLFEEQQSDIFSFIQSAENSSALASIAYDNSLFYKGFLLNAYNKSNRIAESDTLLAEKYLLMKSYSRLAAKEYDKELQERGDLTEIETKMNDVEKQIARSYSGYDDFMRQVSWKEVQQNLEADEVAIEFVRYKMKYTESSDSVFYAALLVNNNAVPKYISMFNEKELASLLNATSDRKSDFVNSVYSINTRGLKSKGSVHKTLYDIIWHSLEPELKGINKIYYAPAGLLHRINIDAIAMNGTETLADKYELIELNSTRQVAIPNVSHSDNNFSVVYGGILYDSDTTLLLEQPLYVSRTMNDVSLSYVKNELAGTWEYLPGSELEVNTITRIMEISGMTVNSKIGFSATEASFQAWGLEKVKSPRVLHIATHGYFFPDPKTTGTSSLTSDYETVFKMSEHPMLRSGLIMAGANAAWQGATIPEGKEDGILTAYEISQMNLSNTELVVLSACETGLGDIQGNEGVYGLQRAFKIAGAKYIIMSLWQVPDKQTSLLMTTFYKKWLEEKMTIPEAFHAAQKQLRDAGLDAYLWAGFVLVE